MNRGEIWWADPGEPKGSAAAFRRPVVAVQVESLNRSRIRTVIVAVVTSNLALSKAPGNVLIKRRSGLRVDSVVNVSSLVTLDKDALTEPYGDLTPKKIRRMDDGLRLALAL